MTKKEILEQIYQYQAPSQTLGQFLQEVIKNDNFDVRVKDLDFNNLFSIYTKRKIFCKQFYPINFQEAMACKIDSFVDHGFHSKDFVVFIDSRFCKNRYR